MSAVLYLATAGCESEKLASGYRHGQSGQQDDEDHGAEPPTERGIAAGARSQPPHRQDCRQGDDDGGGPGQSGKSAKTARPIVTKGSRPISMG